MGAFAHMQLQRHLDVLHLQANCLTYMGHILTCAVLFPSIIINISVYSANMTYVNTTPPFVK